MDMKERKGMAENILFCDLPPMDNVPCILDQVLLGEDRSFGLARRPRGVDEEGRVIGGCILIE